MRLRPFVALAFALCLPCAGIAAVPPFSTPGPAAGVGSSDTAGYRLSAEKREKAIAYARARYRLHFLSFAWGLLVLLVILRLRLGVRLRERAEAASRRRFVQALLYVPPLLVILALLGLPPELYGHHLAVTYDQSVQGWGSWFWDRSKEMLIGILFGTPVVWLLYAILRRNPRRWWVFFWLACLPIIVFLVFLAPVAIDPLFFRFEPLAPRHPELVSRIEEVTARARLSIPRQRMFEMNASEKFKSINAYVTGIGASRRVVVWDTTLARATTPETLFIFGHEMGHYVLRHVPLTIAFLSMVLLVLLAAGSRAASRAIARRGPSWGIRGPGDWASLPVLLLVLTLGSELALPAVNTYSRWQEHQADIFGLEVIHGTVSDSPRAAADAFQKLGEINLADPDPSPFIRFWLYSHPPLAERLLFARTYDPWGKGEKPRYVGRQPG